MNLTQTKLHNLILEVYCEEATDKINQGIATLEKNNLIVEIDSTSYQIVIRFLNQNKRQVAYLEATRMNDPCHVVGWSYTKQEYRNTGLGALIYDIATEVVNEHNSYLACDRNEVSEEAQRQWNYYVTSNDYEQLQLDTDDNLLTPSGRDNANQYIFYKLMGLDTLRDIEEFEKSSQMVPSFIKSPFTKAYRKKNITTLPCLEGRIERV